MSLILNRILYINTLLLKKNPESALTLANSGFCHDIFVTFLTQFLFLK